MNTLKTFDPPLDALVDREVIAMRRRGKLFLVDFDNDLSLLVHLMSGGRLQYLETASSPRARGVRAAFGLSDGGELCLKEFGSQQRAWVKLLPTTSVDDDPAISTLGPEAWPKPPQLTELPNRGRQLHTWLRDQHVIAGIGRGWCDEILFEARLSPFRKADSLTVEENSELEHCIELIMNRALDTYEKTVKVPIPVKLDKPFQIHHQEGKPCPNCQRTLEAVYFSEHVLTYCPNCQNDGRVYKDRRMSKLLR